MDFYKCRYYIVVVIVIIIVIIIVIVVIIIIFVKSSTFMFNDVYYKQVNGVAMGPPLGPALINL